MNPFSVAFQVTRIAKNIIDKQIATKLEEVRRS